MEKIAISVEEAAALLGISVPTAYQLTKRADFPCFKIGTRTVISRAKLIEWVDANATGQAQ